LRWAARAKREEHKNIMLQMAYHWMQTAQKMERADTYRRVPSGARLTSTPTPRDDARGGSTLSRANLRPTAD